MTVRMHMSVSLIAGIWFALVNLNQGLFWSSGGNMSPYKQQDSHPATPNFLPWDARSRYDQFTAEQRDESTAGRRTATGALDDSVDVHGNLAFPAYGHSDRDSCVCNCNNIPASSHLTGTSESPCEWQMVIKAVAGSGYSVIEDCLSDNKVVNGSIAEAKRILSDLPYQHPSIVENWSSLFIPQVMVEVYDHSVLRAWFLFDGTGTDRLNWMKQSRLIASSYDNIKTENLQLFTASHQDQRSLTIVSSSDTCDNTCGYLEVVEPWPSPLCSWENYADPPYFLYGTATDRCGHWDDSDEHGVGDRLVIYAQVCPIGW